MFELFKNPPSEYRLTPIWRWDPDLNTDDIVRQVHEMHEKGIGGFIIRPQLDNADTSDKLVSGVEKACNVARELGMRVYLYDRKAFTLSDYDTQQYDKDYSIFLDIAEHSCSIKQSASTLVLESIRDKKTTLLCSTNASILKTQSSLAHVSKQARVVSEVFNNNDSPISLEQMKAEVNYQMSLGVNYLCPDGLSNHMQAPYWHYYRLIADYSARLSYVLSQGKHKAQIGLLHPKNGYCPNHKLECSEPVQELISEYFNIYRSQLLRDHIDYDVISEESINRALIMDQRLNIAGEEYELLIIPPSVSVDYDTALKIKSFAEDGGKILGTVLLPIYDASGNEHEEIRDIFVDLFGKNPLQLYENFINGVFLQKPHLSCYDGNTFFFEAERPEDLLDSMRSTLSNIIKPPVSVRWNGTECPDITFMHRLVGETDVFFFSNNCNFAREAKISIRCDNAPYMLNPETGEATALPNCTQQGSRTILLHRFERNGSLVVAFSNEPAFAVAPPMPGNGQYIPVSNYWAFKTEDSNCLTLHEWYLDIVGHNDELIQSYTATFEADTDHEELLLVVANTGSPISLYLNDSGVIDSQTSSEYPNSLSYNITHFIAKGNNVIRIEMLQNEINGHPNAKLIGDFCIDETYRKLVSKRADIADGSWTDQGYPFYSGTAIYKQDIQIPDFSRSQRVIVRAIDPADMVEFVVNGASAGTRAWPPFEYDVTALVKPGLNKLELKVTNSPANMLTSTPKPSGLLGGVEIIIC